MGEIVTEQGERHVAVRIVDGRAVADSREVASDYGKQHKNVLRAIDTMLQEQPELRLNFEPCLFPVVQSKGGVRHFRRFDMDRKGFMLLVMGFTGAKALAKKIAWIDAFDAMERLLTERDDELLLTDPAELAERDMEPMTDIRERLLFVREARALGGRSAGRRAWKVAGLADVFSGEGVELIESDAETRRRQREAGNALAYAQINRMTRDRPN